LWVSEQGLPGVGFGNMQVQAWISALREMDGELGAAVAQEASQRETL